MNTEQNLHKTLNIWIVDDDKLNVFISKKIWQRATINPINFIEFEDGSTALNALLESGTVKPDLILLDLFMPVMNGFEFLDALKEAGLPDQYPVVVASALDRKSEIARAKSYPNVISFVSKPLTVLQVSFIERQIFGGELFPSMDKAANSF